MFTDTIITGTTSVTYVRRAPRGNRAVFVPSGDTPDNERKIEIAHEVAASKRVNSLVKFARMRPHPVTAVPEEISIQVKIVHPSSATQMEVDAIRDHVVVFMTNTNVAKIFNQEQ